MTTVLLFHHAQGQTTGFLAFADELREAGHTVHAPDLYDGRTFKDLDEGVAYARQVGFEETLRRGSATAEDLPTEIVYAGFSLGVMPAQSLAQRRPGALGAILYSAAFPTSEFGGPWPQGVAVQIHMMDADPWAEEDRPRLQPGGGRAPQRAHGGFPGPGRLAPAVLRRQARLSTNDQMSASTRATHVSKPRVGSASSDVRGGSWSSNASAASSRSQYGCRAAGAPPAATYASRNRSA
jgi:hypothetical protein